MRRKSFVYLGYRGKNHAAAVENLAAGATPGNWQAQAGQAE
jgi:hypothetical protein